MHLAAALLGLSALGAVAFARGHVSSCLAWAMVSLWAAANLAWLGNALSMMPILDLPVAIAAWAVWYEYRERWQVALAVVFAARLVLHLAYPGHDAAGEVLYLHILNALFVMGCAAISWKGGEDVALDCSDRVRRLRIFLAGHSEAVA